MPLLPRSLATLILALASVASAHAELAWSPGGAAGGSGVWDAATQNWQDGGAQVAFTSRADVVFASPAGTVQVAGAQAAGTLTFADPGYVISIDRESGAMLRLASAAGRGMFGFGGHIGADANSYPPLSTFQTGGIEFRPVGAVRLEADLYPLSGGSPLLAVVGSAGRLDYAGTWYSDTGSIYSWLRLEQGGHLVLTGDADMRFIKDAYYTLQLWVTGDGSGTLELAEDFVADRTEGATQRLGIGSIRMGAGTLVSYRSANLPLGYRPNGTITPQTNGHLVFENRAGSRWIVRGEDQVYPGAVWIHTGMEVRTESDLMHVGVTEFNSDYTAFNGWSVLAPVTVRKTGLGRLVLAGEQAYAAGSYFQVSEGTLVLLSDPAGGRALGGGEPGAQLSLQVEAGAALDWRTDGALQTLILDGTLLLDGLMNLSAGGLLMTGEASRTQLLLGEPLADALIQSAEPVYLDGTVVVALDPAVSPVAGASWVLCAAPAIDNGLVVEDRTGMDLRLVQEQGRLLLVAENPAPDLPGEVWMEDAFDAPDPLWKDLSTVPRWGSPLANGTAFEYTAGVVRLQRSGTRNTTNYTSYSLASGLKTFTALDHQFARPVAHAGSEVTIDFRLRWPVAAADSGEGGRVIVALSHGYPDGGLDLTPEGTAGSRYNDFSAAWWARPAYHVRLRNSTTRAGTSMLQYGGGVDPDGEFERTDNWWLPGFISGAGQLAPGNGDDYPVNSWTRTTEGMASSSFTSFRYRILPDRQELWRDDDGDGVLADNELKAVMPLPDASTAPLYRYFPQFEGIRVFWNGVGADGQMELDWLRVVVQEDVSPSADAGEDSYAQVLVQGYAPVRLDASGTTDREGGALLYAWHLGGKRIALSRGPVAHLLLPEGEHILQLVAIDPAGNHSVDTRIVTVTVGKARPVAEAGADKAVPASNDWFGVVGVSAAASFSPDGSIVRYRWSTGNPGRVLYDGPQADVQLALPIGSHTLQLVIWDESGASAEDSMRAIVEAPSSGEPPTILYRENFSRPGSSYGELGVAYVHWQLTSYTGEPVKAERYNGNAHRCLSWSSYGNAPYVTRINANPTGTEFDTANSGGHLWMNQMPYLNATPAEWLLWTDEYSVDRSRWDLARISYYAMDYSPELVEVAPAVRIAGTWYIGWNWRIEQERTSYWKAYTIDLGATNWSLFEPSLSFSVRTATTVDRLPDGDIEAFGFYFLKEYGWYENYVDNFTLAATPRRLDNPYGPWLVANFPQQMLLTAGSSGDWSPAADPDGDGWANIWEYALGRDPVRADAGAGDPVAGWSAGRFTLDLPANPRANNLTFAVYGSADLRTWQPKAATSETYTDPQSGALRRRWLMDLPADGLVQRFYTWVPVFME